MRTAVFSITLLFGFAASSRAQAASLDARLRGFRLASCAQSVCFDLKADDAILAASAELFDLSGIVLSVGSATYRAQDGYYDVASGSVVLRKIVGTKGELLFNSRTGERLFFR